MWKIIFKSQLFILLNNSKNSSTFAKKLKNEEIMSDVSIYEPKSDLTFNDVSEMI